MKSQLWTEKTANLNRIVLGLYIHDAELARLHHHEPLLRHSIDRLPHICSDELFTAPSPRHWKTLILESQFQNLPAESSLTAPISIPSRDRVAQPLPGDFALCGMLESISALACEHAQHEPGSLKSTSLSKCHELLMQWHTQYQPRMSGKSSWCCLMMLWHSIFIMLHADFNALECACGREGYGAAQEHLSSTRSWVRSVEAKRCMLHAMLIQKNFESLPAGAEPAFHVPLCLYYCGIVWSCFMCFSGDLEPVTVTAADLAQFGELRLQGIDGVGICLEQTVGLQPRRLAMGSLFRIVDLLQRINHWKISQSLASTLLALIEETQDLF